MELGTPTESRTVWLPLIGPVTNRNYRRPELSPLSVNLNIRPVRQASIGVQTVQMYNM